MKRIIAVSIAVMSATSAFAGAVTFTAPEMIAIEEPARMGGSGAWLVPLIIAAVVLLALTKPSTPAAVTTPTLAPGA